MLGGVARVGQRRSRAPRRRRRGRRRAPGRPGRLSGAHGPGQLAFSAPRRSRRRRAPWSGPRGPRRRSGSPTVRSRGSSSSASTSSISASESASRSRRTGDVLGDRRQGSISRISASWSRISVEDGRRGRGGAALWRRRSGNSPPCGAWPRLPRRLGPAADSRSGRIAARSASTTPSAARSWATRRAFMIARGGRGAVGDHADAVDAEQHRPALGVGVEVRRRRGARCAEQDVARRPGSRRRCR